MKMEKKITIQAEINASVEKVWKFYTEPKHIKKWNSASFKWHTTEAENDLRVGGEFRFRMEAKDGSEGFDFEGRYKQVRVHKLIEFLMSDERKTCVVFTNRGRETEISITFDAETVHSIKVQRDGWQTILNNFKKYVENN